MKLPPMVQMLEVAKEVLKTEAFKYEVGSTKGAHLINAQGYLGILAWHEFIKETCKKTSNPDIICERLYQYAIHRIEIVEERAKEINKKLGKGE